MEHKGTKELETERLILRKYVITDCHAMYKNWASDSAVTEFLAWQPHSSVDETKTLLLDWIAGYEKLDNYSWVIELKATKEIGINRICASHDLNNSKSGKVMDKAGMKYEGVLRSAGYNVKTGIHDVVWHSILKNEL